MLRELPYALQKAVKYPYKIARDVQANTVEALFLSAELARSFSEASGVQVALPYRVERTAFESNPIDSRFALALYDFAPALGWRQEAHLKPMELRASLRALADWHAFFWLGHDPDGAKAKLAAGVWETGSYWHLGQQPEGQLAKLKPNWERLAQEFGYPREWDLGARLEGLAVAASEQAQGLDAANGKVAAWANSKYQTIIHGDPKAPNLFFKGEGEVGMIDLQWCGRGIGAVDVAYCIAASADASAFEGGAHSATQALLDEYHQHLLGAFERYGVAENAADAAKVLPRETFQEQVGRLRSCQCWPCGAP